MIDKGTLHEGIVIIDDNPDEAVPLLEALSLRGIPAIYFTGKIEKLPEHPFSDIRAVFLDIVLPETESQNDKTRISTIIGVLGKIIDKNNSPFLIIAWTKHDELLEDLHQALQNEGYKFSMIDMEKSECKNGGSYDVEIISRKLLEKLQKLGALHIFIVWENLVRVSSAKIVNDFSEFYNYDSEWNKNMMGVFLKLAEGFAGKQLNKSNSKETIKNALLSFNSAFLDSLESEIRGCNLENIGLSFSDSSKDVSKEITGLINKKFMMEIMKTGGASFTSPLPGSIYYVTDIETGIKEVKIAELFNQECYKMCKAQISAGSENIILELSPICDYAQNKRRICRILPGLLVPEIYGEQIRERADYIYKSRLIEFEKKLYYLVFDFRFFTSIGLDKLKVKLPKFRLKQQLLVDIQSKLASHINRPGVMFVE